MRLIVEFTQGDSMMTIGDILRNLLADMDITQKQLAEALNIGASTLSNYVQNIREPDYGMIKRLADYFGVSTDYLLDHRTAKSESHNEDDLLRIYRALSQDQQELFIKQGKLLIAQNNKNVKLSVKETVKDAVKGTDIRVADQEPDYKDNGAK